MVFKDKVFKYFTMVNTHANYKYAKELLLWKKGFITTHNLVVTFMTMNGSFGSPFQYLIKRCR